MLVPHALLPCIAAMRITGCIVRKLFSHPSTVVLEHFFKQNMSLLKSRVLHAPTEDSNPKIVTTLVNITSIFATSLADLRHVRSTLLMT